MTGPMTYRSVCRELHGKGKEGSGMQVLDLLESFATESLTVVLSILV